jgi:hypothetical protein
MRFLRAATALLLLAPALAAAAPGPRGPDIPIVATDFAAACPNVAMGTDGDFEVVWNHYYSESHPIPQGIFGRHFDRQGRPTQATEIRLDDPGSIEASFSRVVALPQGGYLVAWFRYRGAQGGGTVGRFLDPAGNPRGPVVVLAGSAWPVALTVVSDSLLVTWRVGEGPLRARRFDFAGRPFKKVMHLTNQEHLGVVGVAPLADSFVVVWERWTGTSWAVEAQRFSLAGKPLGAPIRVNDNPAGGEFRVLVASDGAARYAVAWTKRTLRTDPQTGQQIANDEPRVRFFDAGDPSGPAKIPDQLRTGHQQATGLAMDRRGVALVTWDRDPSSATAPRVSFGRFLDADGQPAGDEFSLLQNAATGDFCPAAATGGDDDAWVAALLKASGVAARRLAFED